MKAKNTVAKKPTTVHWLYSSPIALKVSSAPNAIRTATTTKVKPTCSQNSWLTLNFLSSLLICHSLVFLLFLLFGIRFTCP